MSDITVSIMHDNYPFDERLTPAWGFACVIEGLSEAILFDTGGDGELLLSNMAKLGFKPERIDAVVLSHVHGDHTGGLDAFLRANSRVRLFMPEAFPSPFKQEVRQSGAAAVETSDPCKVCEGAWTTGVLGSGIREQGLYLRTPQGLIVITGCAHPGIVHLAKAAKRHADAPVHAVMGGFHMGSASAREVASVIEGLKKLGVQRVAPSHCSGDETRSLMKEAFPDGYLHAGVGSRLVFGAEIGG